MFHLRRLTIAIFVIGLMAIPASSQRTYAQTTTCPDAALSATQEADILVSVNKARAAANLGPLAINKLLTAAAQRQSDDMASKDFLDHTGSDGSDVGARATAAGYTWTNIGENILYRLDMSAAGAYDQWWNSPPHKANMMSPDFTELGIAVSCTSPVNKYYYAMVLGNSGNGNPSNGTPVTPGTDMTTPTLDPNATPVTPDSNATPTLDPNVTPAG